MPRLSQNSLISERTLMVVLIILVLLLSPVRDFWAALNAPWYSPYIVWAIIIFLAWLLQKYIHRHEI